MGYTITKLKTEFSNLMIYQLHKSFRNVLVNIVYNVIFRYFRKNCKMADNCFDLLATRFILEQQA